MWHELITAATLVYLWYNRQQRQQKYRFKTILFGSDIKEQVCIKQYLPKDYNDKIFLVKIYTDDGNINDNFLVNCAFDSISVKDIGENIFYLEQDLVFKDFDGPEIDDLELYYLTITEI